MDSMSFKPLSKKKRVELLKIIKKRIHEADADGLRRAMLSVSWLKGAKELVEPLMQLITDGAPEVALAALEGLSELGASESEHLLARHIVELFKKPGPERAQVRAECIRVLGKVGTGTSVDFLAELIVNPVVTETDAEAAVEALVSLAESRLEAVSGKLQALSGKTGGRVSEAVECALKELNLSQWQEKGYLTIEAKFQPDND